MASSSASSLAISARFSGSVSAPSLRWNPLMFSARTNLLWRSGIGHRPSTLPELNKRYSSRVEEGRFTRGMYRGATNSRSADRHFATRSKISIAIFLPVSASFSCPNRPTLRAATGRSCCPVGACWLSRIFPQTFRDLPDGRQAETISVRLRREIGLSRHLQRPVIHADAVVAHGKADHPLWQTCLV